MSTQRAKPQGREAGQTPRTSHPSNTRSLREGGGPDAQEQSSTQPKNRKASRLWESYGPHGALLPLHRTTTSQSLVRDGSHAVVGFRVWGRRWWLTSDNGKGRLSLDTSG